MQELGMELKNIRESKGLSLDQVQQDTKIRSRYLEAIEAGDLSVLPGMVYARGFIKSYAEYLGVDGMELLERHGLAAETAPSVADAADASLRRSAPTRMPVRKGFSLGSSRMVPQIAVAVVVLGVFTLVYALVVNRGDGDKTTQNPAQTQTVEPSATDATPPAQQQAVQPAPAPAPEPPKPKTVVQEQQKAQNRTTYAVTSAEPMTLQLNASDSCWVQVIADGQTVETGIIQAGETRAWKANQSVSILTGKSKFITLQVNDQPVQFEPQLRGYTYEFHKQQAQSQQS
ncbi:MAG: RodZ domain-containing protein [Tumebacillaceae bacterium]